MAKSIRISDELYDIALHAGEAMDRSLAQQMEHWARMGAALDAAGITFEQRLRLLQGHAGVHEQVLRALHAEPPQARGDDAAAVAARAALRRRQREAEVMGGRRSPSSLFLFTAKAARSADVVFAPEAAVEATGW